MSELKQEAVQLIEDLPEEQVKYVIQYIQTLEIREKNTPELKAFLELEQMLIPSDNKIDYDKELAEAREEKYGRTD